MASIQKKGNKYYIVAKINGKQKWIPGKRTKKETKEYLPEVLYTIENNIVNKETYNIKLKTFLKNWLDTYGKNNLKLTTYTGYKQHIEKYINPRLGNMLIVDLKPIHLQNMYYDLIENGRINGNKPLNSKTVIQTHRILRKSLKNAVMLQIIESNPADSVELPKKKKYIYEVLQENEIKNFISSFKDTEIYLAVLLAITLGLRRGEILALKWSDIDFKKHTVNINKSLVYSNRQIKIDTTKTEKSNRVLLISNDLLNILEKEKHNGNASNDDYIILNLKNERFNPGSFARRYTELRDRKGLRKVRFHDLRHTNATIMYKSGIKTKVMQERLGHSNISTTLDIYTHLFKEDQEEAAQLFNRKVFSD